MRSYYAAYPMMYLTDVVAEKEEKRLAEQKEQEEKKRKRLEKLKQLEEERRKEREKLIFKP